MSYFGFQRRGPESCTFLTIYYLSTASDSAISTAGSSAECIVELVESSLLTRD